MTDARAIEQLQPAGTTSFVPGRHIGVAAGGTVGLIAQDNPSTRERIWSLVSSGAPLGDVLDELSRDGINRLPDFALAQREGSSVRVVARGSARVEVTSDDDVCHELDSRQVRTWIEQVVDDVRSVEMSLGVAEAPDGLNAEGGFFVREGSVPAGSLVVVFDHVRAADGDVSADTVIDVDESADDALPAEVEPAAAEPEPADEPSADADTANSIEADDAPAGTSEPEAEPEPEPESDVASAEQESRPTAMLVFDSGDQVPVDRAVLIGRNPKITGEVEAELPRIMKYDGPSQGLSRTHAEIRPVEGELVIDDLQSTNGTEIQRGDAERITVVPGKPTPVEVGDTIVFGDGFSCLVTES